MQYAQTDGPMVGREVRYHEVASGIKWSAQMQQNYNQQVQMQRERQEQQQMQRRYQEKQQIRNDGLVVPGLLDLEYEQAMQKVNDQEMSMKEEFEEKMREDAKAMAMGPGQFDGTQDEKDPIDEFPRHLFRTSNWLPNGEYGLIGTWSSDMERVMRQAALK